MSEMLSVVASKPMLAAGLSGYLSSSWGVLLVLVGFSIIVFFHELGHFLMAKWAKVRVERFAVGFGPEVAGFTWGETRYSFNLLPLGGYVKMLGQEDFEVDPTGEYLASDNPDSFINKPVGHRMAIVSAGVVMNLIVAALLFMVVYMVGRRESAPIVGHVVASTPAAEAGLLSGDRIVSINGTPISSFEQIMTAVRLADPLERLVFTIDRDEQRLTKSIQPEFIEADFLQVGIGPVLSKDISIVAKKFFRGRGDVPQFGDIIRQVNGVEITDPVKQPIFDLMMQGRNKPTSLVFERPNADNGGAPGKQLSCQVRKIMHLESHGLKSSSPHDRHLLGLVPRVMVYGVRPKSQAYLAGLEDGDIVVAWGTHEHPTPAEILETIEAHLSHDIPVRVLRDGQVLSETLYYTGNTATTTRTKRASGITGFPLVHMEQDRVVLSGVVEEALGRAMPASKTTLAPGCEIKTLNGNPVVGWADLAEQFRIHAGQTINLGYVDPAGAAQATPFDVPHSLSTKLNLPAFAEGYQKLDFTLDGKEEVYVEVNGKRHHLSAYRWLTIYHYLKEHVGQNVEVSYSNDVGEMVTVSIDVTEDMIDPWYRRVAYSAPLSTMPIEYINKKSNPLAAIWAGTMQTYYFVAKTYLTLKRLIFTRSVSVEQMSGPIGIIAIGSKLANTDKIEMLYFLALISANLAVLNFLPLPIVDGGLMVFLIIEKIKGSPVSVKTQVATQVIGIALFAAIFLFVTFNDLSKLLG